MAVNNISPTAMPFHMAYPIYPGRVIDKLNIKVIKMLELIIALVVLIAIIMFSGMIKSGLQKVGNSIGLVSDSASHLVEAGGDQAKRARVVSNDSLQDTKLDSIKQSAKRTKIKTNFLKDLEDTEKAEVTAHEQWLNDL